MTAQLVPGAIAGVVAWIVGIVVSSILAYAIGVSQMGGGGGGGGGMGGATWKLAGMVFHGAHFVSISAGPISINPVTALAGTNPIWYILLIVPPLALAAGGYYVASNAGTRDPMSGAQAGAMVVAGYLPLALIGAFLFKIDIQNQFMSISFGPSIVMSAVVMGLIYPAVFGAVGGYLGSS